MTFQSIEFLEKYLKHGSNVFEYGGGGSTLYCLDKSAHVVTVEHDLVWFSLLEKAILKDDLSQSWKGIMIEPTIGIQVRLQKIPQIQRYISPMMIVLMDFGSKNMFLQSITTQSHFSILCLWMGAAGHHV